MWKSSQLICIKLQTQCKLVHTLLTYVLKYVLKYMFERCMPAFFSVYFEA